MKKNTSRHTLTEDACARIHSALVERRITLQSWMRERPPTTGMQAAWLTTEIEAYDALCRLFSALDPKVIDVELTTDNLADLCDAVNAAGSEEKHDPEHPCGQRWCSVCQ